MAKFFDALSDRLIAFIEAQHLFFVASAPAGAAGRVNVSPKGMDTLRVVDPRTIAYLDLTGSGAETAAHVAENGRLTFMWCSFGEAPLILRAYGRGEIVRPSDPAWAEWAARFPALPGARQIVVLHVESGQTSCGFAVPRYALEAERPTLVEWAENRGSDGIAAYQRERNALSIDGLPTGLGD